MLIFRSILQKNLRQFSSAIPNPLISNETLNYEYDSKGIIGKITMSNSKIRNAIGKQAISDFNSLFDSLIKEPPRGLIIKSNTSEYFCSGGNLKERDKMTEFDILILSNSIRDLFSRIRLLPFPTIALISGFAFGGGFELSLMCDFRFATKSCILCLPQTQIGTVPGLGGINRLMQMLSITKVKDIIFTGKKIKWKEALELGLIDQVFDTQEEALKKAEEYLIQIAKNDELSILAAKDSIESFYVVDKFKETINHTKMIHNPERAKYIRTFSNKHTN